MRNGHGGKQPVYNEVSLDAHEIPEGPGNQAAKE